PAYNRIGPGLDGEPGPTGITSVTPPINLLPARGSEPGRSDAGSLFFRLGDRPAFQAHLVLHLRLDLRGDPRVLNEKRLRVLPALPQSHFTVREPRPRLLDDIRFDPQVDHDPEVVDADIEHDVEIRLLEWRGDLVL